MQGSPRQGAEHLAAVLQNLLEPFNTYKEREKEGRRAHWDTVLLKGQTEGLIRHQLRKCTHHTEALSPHMSIEEHVPHSPSCRASVLCSRNIKQTKEGYCKSQNARKGIFPPQPQQVFLVYQTIPAQCSCHYNSAGSPCCHSVVCTREYLRSLHQVCMCLYKRKNHKSSLLRSVWNSKVLWCIFHSKPEVTDSVALKT